MPLKHVDKSPVDHVGGTQAEGPWPEQIEEIAVDDRIKRPVVLDDGTKETVEVTVTKIQQILQEDLTETDGYAVTYQFDDPTIGGTL